MFLDEDEFARDETEDEKEELWLGPAFAVSVDAGLATLDEGGAVAVFLIGSPAVSTSVLLFDAGSGTGVNLSELLTCPPSRKPTA